MGISRWAKAERAGEGGEGERLWRKEVGKGKRKDRNWKKGFEEYKNTEEDGKERLVWENFSKPTGTGQFHRKCLRWVAQELFVRKMSTDCLCFCEQRSYPLLSSPCVDFLGNGLLCSRCWGCSTGFPLVLLPYSFTTFTPNSQHGWVSLSEDHHCSRTVMTPSTWLPLHTLKVGSVWDHTSASHSPWWSLMVGDWWIQCYQYSRSLVPSSLRWGCCISTVSSAGLSSLLFPLLVS